MKIYVVETILDYVTQYGFSLSRKVAEEKAKELNAWSDAHEYFVTEYEVKDESSFCGFE